MLKWLVVGVLLAVIGTRCVFSGMEESSIKSEIAFIPTMSSTGDLAAPNMAMAAQRIMLQHQCAEVPGSLTVSVGPPEEVDLNVMGGGVQVTGKGPTQKIDIAFKCRRQGPFFVMKELKVEVSTRGMAGFGAGESHYPSHDE
jgi:hypothetical protein